MKTLPQAVSDLSSVKVPTRMKLRMHVYPDARSTTRMNYCSAWSRRYFRSDVAR